MINQGKNDIGRNRGALVYLRGSGFSLPRIRRALVLLNGISVSSVARACRVSPCLVSNTVTGQRRPTLVRQVLARALGMEEAELWPGNEGEKEAKNGGVSSIYSRQMADGHGPAED